MQASPCKARHPSKGIRKLHTSVIALQLADRYTGMCEL